MKIRFPLIVRSIVTLLMVASSLRAASPTLGDVSRKADRVENKRFERKIWNQGKSNSLADKRFPLKEWDKHFSSVGSKKAPIAVSADKEKKLFKTKQLDKKEIEFGMSRWNHRMEDLHKKAGIQMDDRARLVADQQMYSMMLQDSQRFRDMADEVSLRELNRYQFRRNRTDEGVPVQKAGSEQ